MLPRPALEGIVAVPFPLVILISKGVIPGSFVGLMIDRSIEMIVAILSSLKAGGVYCPIDLNNPTDRKKYILKDCGAEVLITKKGLTLDLDYSGKIVSVDENNNIVDPTIINSKISENKLPPSPVFDFSNAQTKKKVPIPNSEIPLIERANLLDTIKVKRSPIPAKVNPNPSKIVI